MYHIDDNIDTIYYQFQEKGHEQPTTTWYTEIGITNGNNVKTKFEQSMLKWNNVYYYKKTADGIYEKHKIINLVNYDSLTDKSGITPHILIHPYYGESDFAAMKEVAVNQGFTANAKEYKKNKEAFLGHVGDVAAILRLTVSLRAQSPNLYIVMKILGKEEVTRRINNILNK